MGVLHHGDATVLVCCKVGADCHLQVVGQVEGLEFHHIGSKDDVSNWDIWDMVALAIHLLWSHVKRCHSR